MPEIKITCKGSAYVPIGKLKNFQGNLKTLERDELDKLKRSILKHGFSFPVFTWGEWIMDGHQRLFAVKDLVKEGHTIGDIPIVEIEAESKTEAGEKLLLLNSRYAKMSEDGLYEFLHGCEIDISDIAGDLNLPDIDMGRFVEGWGDDDPNFEPGTEEEHGQLDTLSPKMVKCPDCNSVFDSRGHEQS